jgi:hypothetical protein
MKSIMSSALTSTVLGHACRNGEFYHTNSHLLTLETKRMYRYPPSIPVYCMVNKSTVAIHAHTYSHLETKYVWVDVGNNSLSPFLRIWNRFLTLVILIDRCSVNRSHSFRIKGTDPGGCNSAPKMHISPHSCNGIN